MATSEESKGGGGWFPGKYASKAIRRASATSSSHDAAAAVAATSAAQSSAQRPKSEGLRRRSVLTTPVTPTSASGLEKMSVPTPRPTSHRAFGDARTPIGNCHFQIFGLKYPTPTRPIVRVELDGDIRNYEDLTEFFEENFTIYDVSSQVVITLIESYSVGGPEVVGQIVLPLSAYLGMSKPLPAIREHRMFFPLRGERSWDQMGVFRGGFETLPGSAMTKPRQALGFIDMKMEISLVEGKMSSFYTRPPMSSQYDFETAFLETDDVSEAASEIQCMF